MTQEASIESFRLLNPAFLGSVLAQAAQGYEQEAKQGLPFIYAFLVTPLVLHGETRDRLPSSVTTRLVSWTERNGDLLTMFPRRMADVAPATRRAMFFACSFSMLQLGSAACIHSIASKQASSFIRKNVSDEVRSVYGKSLFVGRWLATSGLPTTVLTTLGVRL